MADEYQISDALKELSLEKFENRKTDRIRFRMIAGTVAGFQAENVIEVSGGGVEITGGGSNAFGTVDPVYATSKPIESTNSRKCTLWVKFDDAEAQIQFESEDVSFREGHNLLVLCASTDENNVYYPFAVNEGVGKLCEFGEIPVSAVLSKPPAKDTFLAWGAIISIVFLVSALFALVGSLLPDDSGEVAFQDALEATLVTLVCLFGLWFSWTNKSSDGTYAVPKMITERQEKIAVEVGEYLKKR